MKLLKEKLSQRIKQFKSNPITHDKTIKALYRYISFQIFSRILHKTKYKWINPLKFYAYNGDAGIVGNIYFGIYEFYESMFILHFLRKTDLFIDIGANVGHYSLLASGLNKCKSIAVEPVPETYSRLKQNIELNDLNADIEIMNIGVGNSESELYFSTDKNTMNRIVDKSYKQSIKIPIKTMDSFIELNDTSILKIDVEGYEKFAFEGGMKTLSNKNLKVIIVELNDSGRFYKVSDNVVYQTLLDLDFLPYAYDPLKRSLQKLDSYNKKQFNTIFIRDIDFVKTRMKKSRKFHIWDKKI